MSDKKLFIKNNIFVFSNKIISKSITFGIIVFLTRTMDKSDYGDLTILIMFSMIFSVIQDFGTQFLVVRETAANKANGKNILANTILIKLLTGFLSFSAFVSLIMLLGYKDKIVNLSYIFAIAMIFQSLLLSTVKFFEGKEKMNISSILVISERVFIAVGIFSFSALIDKTESYGLAYLISNLVVFLISFSIIFSKREFLNSVSLKFVKSILSASSYFLIFTVFSVIYYRVDIILISKFLGGVEVATYRAGYQLIETIYFIPMNAAVAFLPFFSKLFVNDRNELFNVYSKLSRQFLFFSIFLAIIFYFKSEWILNLLYSKYSNASGILSILALAVPFVFMNSINGNLLIAIKKEKNITFSMVLSTVIKLIGLFFFLEKYGLIAAASISLFSEFVAFIIQFISVRKNDFKINFNMKHYFDFALLIIFFCFTLFLPEYFFNNSHASYLLIFNIVDMTSVVLCFPHLQHVYTPVSEWKPP